jgi:hypothetical protein
MLLVCNGGAKVLDFHQSLANEYDLGDRRHAGHLRIADQLRIEPQQPLWFLRVAARGRFPFQKTSCPVQFANGIDVADELVPSDGACEPDLQVPLRQRSLSYSYVNENRGQVKFSVNVIAAASSRFALACTSGSA